MLGSVHDAEDALQDASLRAWRGLPRFEGRSSLRSWLYTIATNTCLNLIARRPKRVLPIDYGPATDPHDGTGRAAGRVGLGRALSGRETGRRGRLCGARGALRAARERRAGLHRGASASSAQAARRPDPARGARLLGPRGRGVAGDDRRFGQQRPAARPQGGRRTASRAEPAGDPAIARRRGCARGRRELRGRVGARRRRRGRRDADRGRRLRDAAARGPGTSGREEIAALPGRLAALRSVALESGPDTRKRAGGARLLHLG